jgi:hypothetical protein
MQNAIHVLNTHSDIELKEIAWGRVDWIHLAHDTDKVACACEHGNELPVSTEADGQLVR